MNGTTKCEQFLLEKVQDVRDQLFALEEQYEKLEKENERLRDALNNILQTWCVSQDPTLDHIVNYDTFKRIAEKALAELEEK